MRNSPLVCGPHFLIPLLQADEEHPAQVMRLGAGHRIIQQKSWGSLGGIILPPSAQESPQPRSPPHDHLLCPVLPDPSGLVLCPQTGLPDNRALASALRLGALPLSGSLLCLTTPLSTLVHALFFGWRAAC